MEKPTKIILYILTAILVINLIFSLLGNSNLKSIRHDLEKARITSDSALNELRFSKDHLDSIHRDMQLLRAYINKIENTVALNDAEKRVREERDAKKVQELRDEIKRRREELTHDTLPEIVIVNTH